MQTGEHASPARRRTRHSSTWGVTIDVKNQYVGDINDFLKYSLLRALHETSEKRLLVCWMLTADDDRGDGRLTGYLSAPDIYRAIDPELFDALKRIVGEGRRSIDAVEAAQLVPDAAHHRALLTDDAVARDAYFAELRGKAASHRVLFFDPDNGLDVPSVRKGQRGSSRYLYMSELGSLRPLDCSVVVYQHFPRVKREDFVRSQLGRLNAALGDRKVFGLYSSRVAYLFGATVRDELALVRGASLARQRWGGQLRLVDP